MFRRKSKKTEVATDAVIDRILLEMQKLDPASREYSAMLGHFERAIALRQKDERKKLDWNVLAVVIGGGVQILIIVLVEQRHVMVSKGMGFVHKTEPKLH